MNPRQVGAMSAFRHSALGQGTLRRDSKMENRPSREKAVLQLVKISNLEPIEILLDKTVAALKENFEHYTGIYIYLLEGDTLVLGPYRGRPTEHTRIPDRKSVV